MTIEIDAIGLRIFSELKEEAKASWEKWSPDVRKLAEECAMDAGKLAVMALSGKDVTTEKAHVNAQLANLKVSGQQTAAKVLWEVTARVLKLAATVLLR